MKKVLYIAIPLIAAVLVFIIILVFINQNNGKGALQVTSVPASRVYLDGKSIGQTPLCKCELKDMISTGSHIIRLIPTEGNFEPFEQTITISPQVLTVVDRTFGQIGLQSGSIISLTPIDNKNDAQISIVTFPEASQIFLDNNLQGESPILLKNITESDHELKITRDGYKDKIVRIRTIKGFRLDATIFLGINSEVATKSAVLISSSSASITLSKVLILQTPTGFLRVRDLPSLSGKEIAQVKPGETYQLLDEQNGWYQIKLTNGENGWINSQYAQKQ